MCTWSCLLLRVHKNWSFFHEIAKGEIVRTLDPMCGRRAKKENRKKKQEQKLVCVHKSAQVHWATDKPIGRLRKNSFSFSDLRVPLPVNENILSIWEHLSLEVPVGLPVTLRISQVTKKIF